MIGQVVGGVRALRLLRNFPGGLMHRQERDPTILDAERLFYVDATQGVILGPAVSILLWELVEMLILAFRGAG